jgi:hypothetical protein
LTLVSLVLWPALQFDYAAHSASPAGPPLQSLQNSARAPRLGAPRSATHPRHWPPDSWYRRFPPESRAGWNWIPLTRADRFVVASAMWPTAQHLLATKPVVRLSVAQAQTLAGVRQLKRQPGIEPYLVRAVYFNAKTGDYSVYHHGEKLWILHGCLGAHPVRMHRQALVVFLPFCATDIYVQCTMTR